MEIRNRIVMAPMSTHWTQEDGNAPQNPIDSYEARVAGDVGLISCEAAAVNEKFLY